MRKETFVGVHIHAIALTSSIVACLLVWQVSWSLVALARNPSVMAWSAGPFGLRGVPIRMLSAGRLILATIAASVAVGLVSFLCLYILRPAPIVGLNESVMGQAIGVGVVVSVFVLARLLWGLRDRRYRVYGDARLITAVREAIMSGGFVIFTRAGRAYLRQRFSASPAEFIRLVTERDHAQPAQGAQ